MTGRLVKLILKTLYVFSLIVILLIGSFYIYFRYVKETTFRTYDRLRTELAIDIDSRVDTLNIVNGMKIVKVDLDNNVRYVIHTHWKDDRLKELYKDFSSMRITSEIPVFTKDDGQNARIIRLMSHQFECVPFEDTLSYRLVPESANFVKTACTISIPPAFSQFKGFIVLSLKRVPTKEEEQILRVALEDISYNVYKEIK